MRNDNELFHFYCLNILLSIYLLKQSENSLT